MGSNIISWSSLMLVPFTTFSPNKFHFTGTRQCITVQAGTKQWVTHTTYKTVLSVSNVSNYQIMFNNVLTSNIQQNPYSPTSSNITRACILQNHGTKNIYICTLCSVSLVWNVFLCVKMSSRNITPRNTVVLRQASNICCSTKPRVSSVTKFPPHRYCYTWQLMISKWHTFSFIWWP
jgi:hypothetical protein